MPMSYLGDFAVGIGSCESHPIPYNRTTTAFIHFPQPLASFLIYFLSTPFFFFFLFFFPRAKFFFLFFFFFFFFQSLPIYISCASHTVSLSLSLVLREFFFFFFFFFLSYLMISCCPVLSHDSNHVGFCCCKSSRNVCVCVCAAAAAGFFTLFRVVPWNVYE